MENWNRYYDPSIGRYLQPEPLLQNPEYVKYMALSGHSVSTYAYALNNPLYWIDPNGLDVFNRGGKTILIKPENGDWGSLAPGQRWKGSPDAVVVPDGKKMACPGKSWLPDNDVEVDKDGNIKCVGGPCKYLSKDWPDEGKHPEWKVPGNPPPIPNTVPLDKQQ